MKKLLSIIVLAVTIPCGVLFAQSFTVPQPSYAYWGDLTSNVAGVSVPVTNATNGSIDVVVEKLVNNLAPFHSSLFCFGIQCYDTTANSSAVIPFAGHATELLMADLNKNGALGTSCVTYRIKDVNNFSDFVDVEICYNITTTGIGSISNSATLSAPQPNPADRLAAVSYNLSGDAGSYKIAIYDILGNRIREIGFSEKSGILFLPTSELNSGVYFYSLQSNNKVLSTNKLIVAH
jgi:hypothetical protein